MRQWGIPTVVDRLVQQAILQILEPIIDPTFSESSLRISARTQRSSGAEESVGIRAREGNWVMVDLDLEKFFDRVNHDILMSRLARRIETNVCSRQSGRFLEAGMMKQGVCVERHEGTPQGGPLSPLLANLLLDDLDRELEKRSRVLPVRRRL